MVATLVEFNDQGVEASAIPKDNYGKDLEKIKTAYLKGSTLESLQLQFPTYSIENMEVMLRNEGIAVTKQTYTPKKKRYFRRR